MELSLVFKICLNLICRRFSSLATGSFRAKTAECVRKQFLATAFVNLANGSRETVRTGRVPLEKILLNFALQGPRH